MPHRLIRNSCLLFVVLCTISSVKAQTENDIDTLRLWVSEVHPNPFARISEAEFDSAFTASEKSTVLVSTAT